MGKRGGQGSDAMEDEVDDRAEQRDRWVEVWTGGLRSTVVGMTRGAVAAASSHQRKIRSAVCLADPRLEASQPAMHSPSPSAGALRRAQREPKSERGRGLSDEPDTVTQPTTSTVQYCMLP
ncbi:hypothetical protein BCV70DRAFT_11243 [Testicularia cyperi]|uniref:Uncharacterized protein n=1 Tax=Testicularia cyperi TaxID=1882483 RepID=A0A317XYQ6_9BASI|nr:hypothetical protein BCV70DRAFT_11243 [Testicularia cyperi]